MLTAGAKEYSLTIPSSDGRRLAWLHAHGEVLTDEDGGELGQGPVRKVRVRLKPKEWGQYQTL